MQNENAKGREFNPLCRTREVLEAGDGVNRVRVRMEGAGVNEVFLEGTSGQKNF
jgi:hypothetical protein